MGTRIPAHSYLGDLQELEGRTPLLEPGSTYQLPMLPCDDTLVCPGDIFPIRITDPRLRQIVTTALQAPPPIARLIALIMTNYREGPVFNGGGAPLSFNTIACTVEITKQSADGACLLTQGRQRVELDFENSPQPLNFQSISMHVLQDILPAISTLNQAAWPRFVYQQVNADALAKTLRKCITTSLGAAVGERAQEVDICQGGDPIQLSYWLIGNLPFNRPQRRMLFQTDMLVERLSKELEWFREMQGIYCEQCDHCIAPLGNLVQVNDQGIGGHYVNSHGALHEMLTLREADVRIVSEPEVENSWFPGYAWQIAYCRRCTEHLGWYFTAVEGNTSPISPRERGEAAAGAVGGGGGWQSFYGLRSAALENRRRVERNIERRSMVYELVAQGLLHDTDFGLLATSEEEEDEDEDSGDDDSVEEEEGGSDEWETDSENE